MELAERSKNQTLDKHPRFTGYRKIHRQSGYIQIVLPPDHPFYAMATKSDHRVMEHRLVMAEFLGRSLEPWEVVHHINGIKDDNRIENLELLPRQTEHIPSIFMEQRIRALEKQVDELQGKVTILEAENVLLRAQGLK